MNLNSLSIALALFFLALTVSQAEEVISNECASGAVGSSRHAFCLATFYSSLSPNGLVGESVSVILSEDAEYWIVDFRASAEDTPSYVHRYLVDVRTGQLLKGIGVLQ